MNDKDALKIKFACGDLGQTLTIREYFKELLTTLWEEGEGFSGKRPFGNGGWQRDLVKPLVAAGAVPGTVTAYDEDDNIVAYDPNNPDQDSEAELEAGFAFDRYILKLIRAL